MGTDPIPRFDPEGLPSLKSLEREGESAISLRGASMERAQGTNPLLSPRTKSVSKLQPGTRGPSYLLGANQQCIPKILVRG